MEDGATESEQGAKKIARKRARDSYTHKGKNSKRGRFENRKKSCSASNPRRLGGSISDPLNLEAWSDDNTCAPSPAGRDRILGDQPTLPKQLHDDPLNLEGKIEDFTALVADCHKPILKGKGGKKRKGRTKSRSESSTEDTVPSIESTVSSTASYSHKASVYRYGNYDQYYGYRNFDSFAEDPRVKKFQKEWFCDKDCLDLGSNTGQVTLAIAKNFSPRSIRGIDIDAKLVRIAWKNLHKHSAPITSDGRAFPISLVMSRGPIGMPASIGSSSDRFPHNIEFVQGNYVPENDRELERVQPEYDVILCLSMTKWVHLNWGDEGIKRMFQKIARHLRPGGRLILEPQPWSSYIRRKKLTPTIRENYQNIQFLPEDFHHYLMSQDVGFKKHYFIGMSENKNPGFRRPIHIYCKPSTTSTTSDKTGKQPTPPKDTNSRPRQEQVKDSNNAEEEKDQATNI